VLISDMQLEIMVSKWKVEKCIVHVTYMYVLSWSLNFKVLHTGHPPYLAELLQYHKPTRRIQLICQSLTFSSMAQPFIWFSCFSYLSSHNMQFLTTSHSAVSNTLFI